MPLPSIAVGIRHYFEYPNLCVDVLNERPPSFAGSSKSNTTDSEKQEIAQKQKKTKNNEIRP
jgi:hypothetical protein